MIYINIITYVSYRYNVLVHYHTSCKMIFTLLALLLPSFSSIIIMAVITYSYSIIVMLTHIACRHINIFIALSIIHCCYQWCLLEYYYVVYQFISYCFCPGR
jgi:hypothetical protein